MISMPGAQELLIILVIALVVVGPQRLPELSRSVGRGLREFRKIQDEVKDMVKIDLNPVEPPSVHQPGVSGPRKPTVHRTGRSASSSVSPAAARRAAEAADVGETVSAQERAPQAAEVGETGSAQERAVAAPRVDGAPSDVPSEPPEATAAE